MINELRHIIIFNINHNWIKHIFKQYSTIKFIIELFHLIFFLKENYFI